MAANQGDVDVPGFTIKGEPVTLKCTLTAGKEINARFGDISTAVQRLAAFDLSAYIFIVAKGLDKATVDVEKYVFLFGITNLIKPVSDYVLSLSCGGQPAKKADDEETDSGEG